MKVILLQDIKGTGKKDQILEVSVGFARNFLFPKNLAVEATQENLNSIKIHKDAVSHRKDTEKDVAKQLAAKLSDVTVKLTAKTGENGRLFGAITNKEVADELAKQHKITVDKKKIDMDPIKLVGIYTAEARLYPEVSAKFAVNVEKA